MIQPCKPQLSSSAPVGAAVAAEADQTRKLLCARARGEEEADAQKGKAPLLNQPPAAGGGWMT